MAAQRPPTSQLNSETFEQGNWGRGWRRLVFPGVFLIYLGQTLKGVSEQQPITGRVAGTVVLVAFAVCYLLALRAWNGMGRRFWLLYGTMLALCIVEVFFAHQYAFVMLVFVSVVTIAALGGRAAPILIGFTVVATFVPALIPSWDTGVDTDIAVSLVLVSLAMYGFFAVVHANRRLTEARGEVARLAAENERNRIARDLHDLLGHSLTTITLKAELARRLIANDPAQATVEITEVEELSRRSLADVRAAVANYRDVTLTGEVATGAELLRAAGIAGELPKATDVVCPKHHELFGWVVREGLTNVVRHSRATRCAITLGPTSIEIVDDGMSGPPGRGSGLSGLRERVEAAGGTFVAGSVSPRGWRLSVMMPAAESDGDAPGRRLDASVVT